VPEAKPRQPSKDWKQNPRYVAAVVRLGATVRALREQLGLTLEELAERADLETQQLQKLEVGAIRNPTLVTIFRLAHGLKVPLETLFQKPKKP
jgi:transcriptional regulator with XRE-family HTH domain